MTINSFVRIALLAALAGPSATPATPRQAPIGSRMARLPDLGVTLAEGWQFVFHDRCQYELPATWDTTYDGAFGSSPDGSVIVAVGEVRITNWLAHKDRLKADTRPRVVHDDSERRLWLERDEGQDVVHYIAVREASFACTGEIQIRRESSKATAETTRTIADSIAFAPSSER